MKTMLIAIAALALAAPAVTDVAAQSRKEQADRVVRQYEAPSAAACALLSKDEVVKLSGRKVYSDPTGTLLTNGGSDCDYEVVSVKLYSGPKSEQSFDGLLKNFQVADAPRQPVSGIGERAYAVHLKGRDKYQGDHAMLVVRQREHTMAVLMELEGADTPQSLRPRLDALAKTALSRLR